MWLPTLWPDRYGEGTVSHLLATYFNAARTGTIHQKLLKPRTLNGYMTAARIYILKRLEERPATSITQDQVSDLFTEIARTAPQMVRNVKKVISGAYEHARATNWRGMRSYPKGFEDPAPKLLFEVFGAAFVLSHQQAGAGDGWEFVLLRDRHGTNSARHGSDDLVWKLLFDFTHTR